MCRLHHTRGSESLVAVAILSLLLPCLTGWLSAGPAAAQGVLKTVAVLPFVNKSETFPGDQYGRAAADAFALALEATKQFEVTSAAELDAVLRSRDVWPPLDTTQLEEIGRDLGVDMVAEGTVTALNVNIKRGQGTAGINVRLLDVAVGEFLNGAQERVTTGRRPRPYDLVEDRLISEALRQVSDAAVGQIVSKQVPKGSVLLVDDTGAATLSLGFQEGLREGHVVVTLRPTWVPETEQVILRKVGTMDIVAVNPHLSVGKRRSGQLPMVRDEFLLLYTPKPFKARQRQKEWSKRGRAIIGLLGVGALVLLATGDETTDMPGMGVAFVHQPADGAPTGILVTLPKERHPSIVVGYVVHRGLYRDFQPDGAGLSIEQPLNGEQNRTWLDTNADPQLGVPDAITIGPKTFIVGDEELEVSADVDFTHDASVPGQTYWYRSQTVIRPRTSPGSNPPGGGALRALRLGMLGSVGARQITLNDADLTDLGPPFPSRGVTVLDVPLLIAPLADALGQSVSNIQFEWSSAAGADEYMLQVFAGSTPTGRPVLQRRGIRFGGASHIENVTFSPALSGTTQHTWRVGVRADNEPQPNQDFGARSGRRGWVFSELRRFTTQPSPPPPP